MGERVPAGGARCLGGDGGAGAQGRGASGYRAAIPGIGSGGCGHEKAPRLFSGGAGVREGGN